MQQNRIRQQGFPLRRFHRLPLNRNNCLSFISMELPAVSVDSLGAILVAQPAG